ncbi:MAG: tetratricopeptide repeat protein [Proteobacteria bacterium]|nr:tetratricopeptide repeat protein [Pseudomonadota bacterium]
MEPRARLWEVLGKAGVLPAFLALALALWAPSLSGPFVLDDLDNIYTNPSIRMERLSLEGLAQAAGGYAAMGRPVPRMSFALDYWLHGLSAGWFRVHNVVLHALAAFFLFLLFRLTLERLPRPGGASAPLLAAAAAALWLAHPVQTQAVSYVVQRMAVMAALFSVVSLWAYARGRLAASGGKKGAWFLLCGGSGLLALGSKETAVVLPFLILLYEGFFFRDLSARWLARSLAWVAGAVAVVLAAALVYTEFHPFRALESAYELRDFSLGQRVLTQFRVVARYASLLAAPLPGRLNLAQHWEVSRSLLAPPATLAALAAILLALGAAVAFARKRRLASFAVFWFFGNLVLESSVYPLEMSFDHRLYLASAFPVLALAVGAGGLLETPRQRVAVFLLVLAVLGAFSFQRNRFWGDGEALWADCLKKGGPQDRCYRGLGFTFLMEGDLERSARAYEQAVAAERERIAAHARTPDGVPEKPRLLEWDNRKLAGDLNTLGGVLVQLGRLEQAEKTFREALAARPEYSEAMLNLGLVLALAHSGRSQEAGDLFKAVLGKDSGNLFALLNMGDLASAGGDAVTAAGYYERAVLAAPDSARAHESLGRVLAALGRDEAAREHLALALSLAPGLSTAREALTELAKKRALLDSETSRVREALARRPDDPRLHNRLGNLFQGAGDLATAARHYRDAVEADPGFAEGWSNLGNLSMARGDFSTAREFFSRALSAEPDNIPALYNLACASARQDRPEEAAAWLERLSRAGFSDWDQARQDPDLAGLWDRPECRDLIVSP